ncbi:uncharacterized protein LOC126747333 [Anthonomus grandis grandis]|uniref:uncharacterized protein LOC126747333 n=1 Tax=Anthonomus grandis grandis TaxID=2921223 RepID=UPI002164FDB1|nr:uncharacterized protein LOC126747333 [Anthonomus grandis grandis]
MMMRNFLLVLVVLCGQVFASPFIPEELEGPQDEPATTGTPEEQTNSPKDLYVIRKVVYEIGILTDVNNSSDFDNKTHEQIDVSFFDPSDNGSFVDLSNIPFPVEANVSGVALTGILPSNFGNLVFPNNGSVASLEQSALPVFPDKQVKVTKNISTNDKQKGVNILSGINDILGLSDLVNTPKEADESKQTTPS